ncbi:MAG: M23 family metallopeptidase [Gemmatimonadetes bacterium]|nr:M23 family metallopeptidase [Gemmatimonadota bacterium]
MARSKWTLMLIPHDNERVRSVQVSSNSVRALLSVILIAVLLSASFSVGFFLKQNQHWRAQRLERENLLLAAEVGEMRGQMKYLSKALDVLAEKDQSYRLISGLPVDENGNPVRSGAASVATGLRPGVGQQVAAAASDLRTLMRRAGLLRVSMDEAIVTLKANTDRLEATPSIAPADGPLSSLFSRNRKHPVLRISRPHTGIDIAAPTGEPIMAPAKGVVTFAGNRSGGYGQTVEIDHGYGYVTRFAHASRVLVRTGQRVQRGDRIAQVGATGLTSGPHLHYEVEVNGNQVDPLNFIMADVIPD